MTIDPLPGSWRRTGRRRLQAVIVVFVAIGRLADRQNWSASAMRRARVDTGTQILVKRALSASFVVVTVLIVLGILGVSSVSLLKIAGAVGLAFSLAVQDILKNFFAGVYLLLERPFRVGDTGSKLEDQEGTVENIGVRTTVLRTPEECQILVPNAIIFTEIVTNHTSQAWHETAPAASQTEDGGRAGLSGPACDRWSSLDVPSAERMRELGVALGRAAMAR